MADNSGLWTYGRAMQAVTAGDLETLEEWIKEAMPSPSPSDMDDLMMQAVVEEQDHMFATLLKAGAAPSKFISIGPKSPLVVVLKKNKGNIDTLNLILSHVKPKKVKEYVNCKDKKGYTPLYSAARNCHVECVKRLLECGAQVNKTSCYDGFTPLMAACEKGNVQIAQALIDAGANVNKTTMLGDTALCWAAKTSQVSCMRVLLQAGANVNSKLKCGESALMAAAKSHSKDSLSAVKELLSAGADITCKDWRNQTVLWYASNYASEDVALFIAREMHEAKLVDVDLSMLVAVERDHQELVKVLLENGWSVDRVDKYGRGVLHVAAERGITQCLELILQSDKMHMLDVNAVAGRWMELCPLHLAIRWCHPQSVDLLMQGGADTNWKDREQASPLMACMATSELRARATMVKLILRHGCNIDDPVMPKVVQPWGLEQFDPDARSLRPAFAWGICFQELWFAKMLWLSGAKAGEVASWTEASLPWPAKLLYPQDEYAPTASKMDILEFILCHVCQPRSLSSLCTNVIRSLVEMPIHLSIQKLPLPAHILKLLNLPELDEIEKESLLEDQGFRDKLCNESDDEFDIGSTSSDSNDSDVD